MLSVKERLGNHCTEASSCECNSLPASEPPQNQQKTLRLWLVIGLLSAFLVVEWGTGLWSHSLSLQADAGHLLLDVGALGLSLLANWFAQQPAQGHATFGHRRIEILAALVNGLSLCVIAGVISWEAMHRFQSPEPVLGLPMLVVAGVGLGINLLNITLLHQHSHNDLNLRGALLHILADTASSISIMLAALAVHLLHWLWVDAAISLLVAGLISLSAFPLVQESLKILMEYAPHHLAPAEVETFLKSFPGICQVEQLYIWSISSGQVMLCAQLSVDSFSAEERDRLLRQLKTQLKQEFGIQETVLQLSSRSIPHPVKLHPLFNQNLISRLARIHDNSEVR